MSNKELEVWVAIWELEDNAGEGYEPITKILRRMAERFGNEPEKPPFWEREEILDRMRGWKENTT